MKFWWLHILFFRAVVEEFKTEPIKSHSPEVGVSTSVESFQNSIGCGLEILRKGSGIPEVQLDGSLSGNIGNQRIGDDLGSNTDGRDKDMEKALKHQALLIGQYEEMERAQREWEEKFRENNTSATVCFFKSVKWFNVYATLLQLGYEHKLLFSALGSVPLDNEMLLW